jgi:hypothetical protein
VRPRPAAPGVARNRVSAPAAAPYYHSSAVRDLSRHVVHVANRGRTRLGTPGSSKDGCAGSSPGTDPRSADSTGRQGHPRLYGRASISAVTIAKTDCQNALAELVGWTGWRGIDAVMPLVGSEMYAPAVLNWTLLAPRDEVTRTVIFAWLAICRLWASYGGPRPCGATRPGGHFCGPPYTTGP